jgi:hypothetical protein
MLKLLFNKKALFGALVAGATSLAFFSNVNLNTERAHAMPQEAQPNIYLRTVFQTHRPILADVGARLGCEEERAMETNPAPRGLSQEHADTLIEAFERASTPLERLCVWQQADPFISPFSMSLNNTTFHSLRAFQEEFAMPENYQAWQQERFTAALEAIENDPAITSAARAWRSQDFYRSDAEALAQYTIKQGAIQAVSDHIRHAFGYQPIPVILEPFSIFDEGIMAYYDTEYDFIHVNYRWDYGVTYSFDTMLETMAEEAMHSIDTAMAHEFLRGAMNEDDPRYLHAASIILNKKNYVMPDAETVYRFRDLAWWQTLLRTAPQRTFDAYEDQYIERTAKDFARNMVRELN